MVGVERAVGWRELWGGEHCGERRALRREVWGNKRQVWCGARRRGETVGKGVQVEEHV